VGTA